MQMEFYFRDQINLIFPLSIYFSFESIVSIPLKEGKHLRFLLIERLKRGALLMKSLQ